MRPELRREVWSLRTNEQHEHDTAWHLEVLSSTTTLELNGRSSAHSADVYLLKAEGGAIHSAKTMFCSVFLQFTPVLSTASSPFQTVCVTTLSSGKVAITTLCDTTKGGYGNGTGWASCSYCKALNKVLFGRSRELTLLSGMNQKRIWKWDILQQI